MEQLSLIQSEIALATLTCVVMLVDVFSRDKRIVHLTITGGLALVLGNVLYTFPSATAYVFSDTLKIDQVSSVLKAGILAITIFVFSYARDFFDRFGKRPSEFFILGLFSVLGMMILVSANNMLTVYLGLELLSLSLYAMVALERESVKASEAALKYFVLGALASGILLYGMSMLYGAAGTLDLRMLSEVASSSERTLLFVFGLVFILVGVAFKLGVVPFHMWIPDVYEGSRTPVTLFLSSSPKIASFAMSYRLLAEGLGAFHYDWVQMLILLALLSMYVGNISAIAQTNYKRMLAYSTISHMGFLLVGLIAASPGGYASAMFYVLVYSVMGMGAFGAILLLLTPEDEGEEISKFQGLAQTNPWTAAVILILMFSLAGIPPFAGFWAKWFVLKEVIASGYLWLATLAVLSSLIGAFYYLRIVKIMYFDKATGNEKLKISGGISLVFNLNCGTVVFLGFYPGFLMSVCIAAILSTGI